MLQAVGPKDVSLGCRPEALVNPTAVRGTF